MLRFYRVCVRVEGKPFFFFSKIAATAGARFRGV